jgi:ATP-binding cassette, subfamily B, bacterial
MIDRASKKFTFKEHISLIVRGLKIYHSLPKPILLAKTISNLFNSVNPFINIYFSSVILNELAGSRNKETLIYLVLLTIGINLIVAIIRSFVGRWTAYCDSVSWMSMNNVFTDKLLSMDYIDVENPKIQQEISEIRQHQNGMGFGLSRLTWTFDGIVSGIIQIILSVALAFSLFAAKVPADSPYSYLDSPIAIIIFVIVLLCSIILSPYLSMIGGKIWAKASSVNNKGNRFWSFYYYNMIHGSDKVKDIRIYDQKRLIEKDASGAFNTAFWYDYSKYYAKYSSASTAISHLANGLIYLFVALKAFAGAFGVGSIVLYVGAISQLGSGFSSVFNNVGTLINNNVFLDKIFDFLDIPNKKYQGTLSVEKRDDNDYQIEFKNVCFKYPGNNEYVLKDLNLKFQIGQKIAVVGMNGSGKTTMIKLLCRLYDPDEGMITLNGIDIKKYNYDEYMAIFSVVFQDFKLLPFTISQNVASSVDVDKQRVTGALSKSGFTSRLDNMPKGIDTYLYKNFEEDGVEISGGEAQKIALARALYKNAPFIVLDEPTAALDPLAEYEIYSKFNDIVGDKTAIYISHRLSSCRFCDDIVVFHEGKLIQRGSHNALIADISGKYYELWNAQAQYYAENKATQN